jgi:hypothetical protein
MITIPRPLLALARTLHIYLSMLVLVLLLFFSITGFVLNHEDWFFKGIQTRHADGKLPQALVDSPDPLQIVEWLRREMKVKGLMNGNFESDEESHRVAFRSPGRNTQVTIDKVSGAVSITFESRGLYGRLDDLHKGMDTGLGWRIILDVSAGLMVFSSLTGIILWLALPKRLKIGLAAVLVGALGSLASYLFLVP